MFGEGFFKKDFTYLFLERGEGREKEKERNTGVWSPLSHPKLGTWPATQACALTRNLTSDPLVRRLALGPLSHTSQGCFGRFLMVVSISSLLISLFRLFHFFMIQSRMVIQCHPNKNK